MTTYDLALAFLFRRCPKCGGNLTIRTNTQTGERFAGCSEYKAGCNWSRDIPSPADVSILSGELHLHAIAREGA